MDNKNTPTTSAHPLYLMLRSERIEDFNAYRAANDEKCDLSGSDFRGIDLRNAELNGIDLSNCWFRQTDLRGLDLRSCNLCGASIRAAKISGTYFPEELSSDEILLSLNHGTRMRYR